MGMSAAPQPVSLAELRALRADVVCLKSLTPTERTLMEAYPALLDIAEAAQAVAHEAEFYADDDTPDDSLIVVPRADMKKLDEALARVTP